MQPLRVGIVGAGAWAVAAHIPAFQACDGVEVVAICDRDVDQAGKAAEDGQLVYGSVEAMIAGGPLDIVSIATPTASHRAVASVCLAAGLHVLCEKPLAFTVDDARALAAQARNAGVRTKVGFTMRYAPAVMRLQELVAEGALGTPYLMEMFLQNGQFLDPARPRHWKMTIEHAGAGAVAEYGIHGLDLARWILGEVERVCASGRTFVPRRPAAPGGPMLPVEVEDSCGWLMEFANGGLGVCHAGWTTVGRAPGLEIRIYGSHGAAQVLLADDLPGSERLLVATAENPSFEPAPIPQRLATPIPPPEIWRRRFHHNLVQHFIDEIRGEQAGHPDFEDGLRAQELLAATVRSMAEDGWTRIADVK